MLNAWNIAFVACVAAIIALFLNPSLLSYRPVSPSPRAETPDTAAVSRGALPAAELRKFLPAETKTITVGPATIEISPLSELIAPAEPDPDSCSVTLVRGSINVKVKPLRRNAVFAVHAPNATAGVRGTSFRVSTMGSYGTQVDVFEGSVFVVNSFGDSIVLGAGQSASVFGLERPRLRYSSAAWRSQLDSTLAQADRAYLYSANELARLRQYAEGSRERPDGFAPPPGMVHDSSTGSLEGIELATFGGNGTWSSVHGWNGIVMIEIDPKEGSFSGRFTGTSVRGGVKANMAGTFGGAYSGSDKAGSMSGTVTFGVSSEEYAREVGSLQGRVSGTLKNGMINGSFQGEQIDGDFEVTVKIE